MGNWGLRPAPLWGRQPQDAWENFLKIGKICFRKIKTSYKIHISDEFWEYSPQHGEIFQNRKKSYRISVRGPILRIMFNKIILKHILGVHGSLPAVKILRKIVEKSVGKFLANYYFYGKNCLCGSSLNLFHFLLFYSIFLSFVRFSVGGGKRAFPTR